MDTKRCARDSKIDSCITPFLSTIPSRIRSFLGINAAPRMNLADTPTINERERERGRLKMKKVKIDSFEMKFDAEREREILHSLEILMLVAVIICLQGERMSDCNGCFL